MSFNDVGRPHPRSHDNYLRINYLLRQYISYHRQMLVMKSMNRTQHDDEFHGEPIIIKEKSCKPEAHYGRVGIIDLCVLIVANVLNQETLQITTV